MLDRWRLAGALPVELQEAGEDFVANLVGPTVAPWLAAAARGVFLLLVVQEEFAGGLNVGPAVGVEDCAVHRSVEFPETHYARLEFVPVMKTVISGRQTFVVLL